VVDQGLVGSRCQVSGVRAGVYIGAHTDMNSKYPGMGSKS